MAWFGQAAFSWKREKIRFGHSKCQVNSIKNPVMFCLKGSLNSTHSPRIHHLEWQTSLLTIRIPVLDAAQVTCTNETPMSLQKSFYLSLPAKLQTKKICKFATSTALSTLVVKESQPAMIALCWPETSACFESWNVASEFSERSQTQKRCGWTQSPTSVAMWDACRIVTSCRVDQGCLWWRRKVLDEVSNLKSLKSGV